MEKRQVKLDFLLTGKSYKDKRNILPMNNKQIHACMLNQIQDHFGDRPVYVSSKFVIISEENFNYPEFYAAGWFVSSNPISGQVGKGSELVVVAHGNNVENARKNLMTAVGNTPWDELAKNI